MRMILSLLRRLAMTSEIVRRALYCVAIGCALAAVSGVARAQTQTACGADGYRVTGKRWDAVLGKGYEYRQECGHPERPARLVMLGTGAGARSVDISSAKAIELATAAGPLLVNAGSPVRLWMQDDMVRIEMSGVVERSARKGEHVTVQVTHQNDETGLTVDRVAGIVRGPGEVEMER
ncbi:MAG TPA: flagella basal body P-ring formation protein FlgA [Acidobacteriaceae bacterium]|nr:flagella basal body P-ring formation protein FlgA [Acidobacteriaceae bacterium]